MRAADSTKIHWEELQVGEQLGEGTWGPTFAAEQICAHGLNVPVAVTRLDLRDLTADKVAAFRETCELQVAPLRSPTPLPPATASLTSSADRVLCACWQVCLHHPNILPCYGGAWGSKDANVCLVKELGGRGSLFALMADQHFTATMTWAAQKTQIALGIARGLAFMHQHHLYHGAIKPHNAADRVAHVATTQSLWGCG